MFCKYCGSQIKTGAVQNTGNVSYASPAAAGRRKYLIVAAAVVAVAVVVILGIKFFGGPSGGFSSYEDVVKAYVSAMENKNEEEYLKCFSEALRDGITKDIEQQAEYESAGTVGGDIYGAGHSPYRFLFIPDDLEYSYSDKQDISEDQLDFYNDKYSMKADEGITATIKFSRSFESMGGTVTRSNTVDVPIVREGRKWFALEPLEISGGWPTEQ